MRRWYGIAMISGLLAISGCQTTPAPPPTPVISAAPKPSCLPMRKFSTAQSKQLADEWAILKVEHPAWLTSTGFIPSSVTLRNENRAACAPK